MTKKNTASNIQRLIHLAETVFEMRTDSNQLDVNDEVRQKLSQLHPACLQEVRDVHGPVIWLLTFPTTKELADQFSHGLITEKQLFDLTPLDDTYQAIYLCSALALPEARGAGKVYQLALEVIAQMRQDHPITQLLVWPFTKEGDGLAKKLADAAGLPLVKVAIGKKDKRE